MGYILLTICFAYVAIIIINELVIDFSEAIIPVTILAFLFLYWSK